MPENSGTIAIETPQSIGLFGEHEKKKSAKKKTRGRKAAVLLKGDAEYSYKGRGEIMLKNNSYFKISQIVYEKCRSVGDSISYEELYEIARPEFKYSKKEEQKDWIERGILQTNRWAKRMKFPQMLGQSNGRVVRRGT